MRWPYWMLMLNRVVWNDAGFIWVQCLSTAVDQKVLRSLLGFHFPACLLLFDQKATMLCHLWDKFTELTQGQIGKIYGRKLLFENKHLLLLMHGDNFLKNKYIFRIWIRPWLFNPLDYLETFTRWFPRGRIYKRDGLSLLGIRFLTRSDIVIECGWLLLTPAIKLYSQVLANSLHLLLNTTRFINYPLS
jgi:hypothetical protein